MKANDTLIPSRQTISTDTTLLPSMIERVGFKGGSRSSRIGFVVYEDYFAGIRARKRFQELNHELSDISASLNMWKMNYLGRPPIRELAVQEARVADLVIISINGDEELPRGMRCWLKEWLDDPLRCRTEILAIVKCSETLDGESPGLGCLRREAERADVPFSWELARPVVSFLDSLD